MAETRSGSGRLSRLATGPKGHARKSCRPCGKSRQWDSIAACAALESDMTHISGFERSQLLLLPEAIDEYVVADNPAACKVQAGRRRWPMARDLHIGLVHPP
jgi:hypothetical protein